MIRTTKEELLTKLKEVHGDLVEIDLSTFIGMNKKARFIHRELGEWWASPTKVIVCGQNHPSCRLLTIDMILTKLKEVHGDLVTIDASTYSTSMNKARFIDKDYGEFYTNVSKVINGGTHHPLRAATIQRDKIRASHARESFRQDMSDKIKSVYSCIKETNKAKYGVEYTLQRSEVTELNRQRFLTEEALAKKAIVKKLRRERHNIKRQAKRKLERNVAVSETGLYPKDRYLKAMQDNGSFYNIDGKPLKEHWRELFSSNISYSYLCKMYVCSKPSSLDDLSKLVQKHNIMSDIELNLSSNSLLTRFDKYPCKYAGFRPDFKVNDALYVNVDGLYWHCDKVLDVDYHIKLKQKAEAFGISIIQFRADEIKYKRDIVDSMIAVKAGLANKKHARKLTIEEITVERARLFLESNHIMGFNGATVHVGLLDETGIVAMISVLISNESGKIVRYCGALNTVTVGGYSKLLKFVINKFNLKEITTFIDLRYGSVKSLVNLGFKHISTTLGWKWTDYDKTYNRLQCRANMDERGLSEKEYSEELKWVKIHDAGQAKLMWSK